MKSVLTLIFILSLVYAQNTEKAKLTEKVQLEKYQLFLHKYNKTYNSIEEINTRFQIFKENLSKSKTGGISKFMDLTPEEFQDKYLTKNLTVLGENRNNTKTYFNENKNKSNDNKRFLQNYGVPYSWDWRLAGAVNPVQSQGECGSCWAFSALANIEGQYFRKYGVLPKFSEQQLVDCDMYNSGCYGGIPHMAFEYMQSSGVQEQNLYPYQDYQGQCYYNGMDSPLVNSYTFAGSTDEEEIKQMLYEVGPLSITMNGSTLQYYTGGIINLSYDECPYAPSHGVNLVGYGTEYGLDYWIIRNTWGSDWGEEGYFRIARGYGLCGINQYVTTAILN